MKLSMSMFASREALEAAKQKQDAERYRFLAQSLVAADFDYNGEGWPVIIFSMPRGFSVSADCDETIDSAMAVEAARKEAA